MRSVICSGRCEGRDGFPRRGISNRNNATIAGNLGPIPRTKLFAFPRTPHAGAERRKECFDLSDGFRRAAPDSCALTVINCSAPDPGRRGGHPLEISGHTPRRSASGVGTTATGDVACPPRDIQQTNSILDRAKR